MAKVSYKERIHKNKFSLRNLRYAAADQLAVMFPHLRERWLFPGESVPMSVAAESAMTYPTLTIAAAPPAGVAPMVRRPRPLASVQKVYAFRDAIVTGQSGALIQHGKLLAVRPRPNWAVSLRPRRHKLRELETGPLHYVLLPPAPAIGHVFHWVMDYVSPFMGWMDTLAEREPVTLIVNAKRTTFQDRTLEFLRQRYDLPPFIPLAVDEAAFAPRVAVSVLEPFAPRAMQTPAGLAALPSLAAHLSEGKADLSARRRIYISRNDAKLRRVVNEEALAPLLERHGFETVILKGMPIAGQVRLFMEAEAIAAPHGAGLTHIAWCRRGAKVTEFFPAATGPRGAPRNATANFWILSQQMGLDYAAYEAEAQINRQDGFRIPETLLDEALTRMAL